MWGARTRNVGELGLLAAVGLVPLAYHLWSLSAMSDPVVIATGAVVPITCSLLVVAATVPVARSSLFPAYTLRVAGWSVVAAVTLGGVALLFITYGMSDRPPMTRPGVVVIGSMSVGSVFGLVFGLSDARQQRTEDQLEQANAQLTVLNRVLRHNIRNAMTVINGRVEILRQHADDSDETAESAAVVAENVDRLLSVSEHARHIDTVTGSDTPDNDVETVVDLVDDVSGAIERLRAEHPGTEFDMVAAETCRVRAHPLTEAVVSEVIENAVVHNEGDVRRVSVSIRRDDAGVTLRVVDDGPGIPEETVETIRRGYETSMRHTDGLGLWLVRWVVDRSDADLAFESAPDGQVVRIRFERVEETVDVPPAVDRSDRVQ